MRAEDPEIQKQVIERGTLTDCQNPSSAVMGRIREAKANLDSRRTIEAFPGSVSVAQVEAFIQENSLDDNAARLIRFESPRIQAAVLERGSLIDCRNPSSAVMGRIRDAKAAIKSSPAEAAAATLSGSPVLVRPAEVKRFCIDNSLDGGATRILCNEPPEVQRLVLDRGPTSDCSNPSASIMGRLTEARAAVRAGKVSIGPVQGQALLQQQMQMQMPMMQFPTMMQMPMMQLPTMLMQPFAAAPLAPLGLAVGSPVGSVVRSAEGSAELESFVQSTSLDASAEKALRSESREVQMSVLSRGTLENCLNPSSAVMGRIHEARKELMHKVILERRGAAAGGADSDRGGSGADADLAVEVEQFIQENRLDETAARSFKIEAPQVQRAVLDRGSMHDCINPSAAVIGRMRDAKLSLAANAAAYTSASGTALVERVDIFIKENGLDDNAARCLRTELPVVQADVLERGSLADCVNASAAVMGRVRDAKGRRDDRRRDGPVGVGAGLAFSTGGSGSAAVGAVVLPPLSGAVASREEVEFFVRENSLDDGAMRALLACPPDVQAAVLERGSLTITKNPSSALMGRIKDAKLARNRSAPY